MACVGFLLLTIFYSEIQASSINYIIHGELAKSCEFPHIAFLYMKRGQGTLSCGGSLIDDRHIVTAAHCVDGDIKSVHALFGSLNVKYMTEIISVSSYAQHSNYHQTRDSFYNDVAVLTLSRPVKFTKCRKSIRMVKPNERILTECVVAGWGTTSFNSPISDLLRRADVPIMPLSYCVRKARGITNQHVCAGDGSYYGRSACKGDSGGPLMCKSAEDGERVLVGLVSYGWTCKEGFGIYASVRYFRNWIKAQTEK